MSKIIFKSSGIYLGFIDNDFLFSRDGQYLGWLEGAHVWGADGQYRGNLNETNGNLYILRNMFVSMPIPRPPKISPNSPSLPQPPANINPIQLPIGFVDAF